MMVLRSIVSAFACFSVVPMPQLAWDESNMRYMMAAFPLVGLLVGCCVRLWSLVSGALGLGTLAWATGLALVPIAISGAIHMDGFADVVDALSSHAEPARKREILKDPHVGAFAVVGISAYLLVYVALACELDARQVASLAWVPVISRILSGYAAVTWPPSSETGMLAAVQRAANRPAVRNLLAMLFALGAAALLWAGPLAGTCALVVALVLYVLTFRLTLREFGGLSGDLLGFYLQVVELAMLACLALVGRLV